MLLPNILNVINIMLNVQNYLLSGWTVDDLNKEFGINATFHTELPLVLLNYDQIESPKTHCIVRECRALVLCTEDWSIAARSFPRFFNHGEVADEPFDFNNCIVTDKEDGCFEHKTPLNLWDGGTITIGEIVNKRVKAKLIGMDDKGNLVPTYVTDWHNNGTKNNWLEFKLKYKTHGKKGIRNGIGTLRVTSNHGIFVNNEEVPAKEITVGTVLTSFKPSLNKEALHFIESSLLGDGSLTKNGIGYKYNENHVNYHLEYSAYLMYLLGDCAIKPDVIKSGYGSTMFRVTSKTYDILNSLRKKWYPNGKKIVPKDLSWVDDFTIAKWYMDDGCLSTSEFQQDRAIFSTHGFKKSDVKKLCNMLNARYGVDAVLSKNKGKWAIRVNTSDTIDVFWKAIALHIIPCMRYKLPIKYRNEAFTPYNISCEIKEKIDAVVLSVKSIPNTKKNFPSGRCGYDITTTTNNYFAKNVLVHNSLLLIYWFKDRWMAHTRGSFNMDNSLYGTAYTWKQLILEALGVPSLDNLELRKDLTYVCELCSLHNKVVRKYSVPTLYLLSAFCGETELHWEEVDNLPAYKMTRVGRHHFKSLEDIMAHIKKYEELDPTYEGIVSQDINGRRKIKSPTYYALHHMSSNGNLFHPKYLLPFIMSGEQTELLTYFQEVEETLRQYEKVVFEAYDQLLTVWKEHYMIENQKEFALSVQGKSPFTNLLFRLRKDFGTSQEEKHLKLAWRENGDQILKVLFKNIKE